MAAPFAGAACASITTARGVRAHRAAPAAPAGVVRAARVAGLRLAADLEDPHGADRGARGPAAGPVAPAARDGRCAGRRTRRPLPRAPSPANTAGEGAVRGLRNV